MESTCIKAGVGIYVEKGVVLIAERCKRNVEKRLISFLTEKVI